MITLDLNTSPAGELVAENFEGWPEALREELEAQATNGHVGQRLLRQTDSLRVWTIELAPGERLPFHRHVLDYLWIATSAGSSIQRTHDGTTRRVRYRRDDHRKFRFAHGEYLLHDLENVGDSDLTFVTIEYLNSTNPPLALRDGAGA